MIDIDQETESYRLIYLSNSNTLLGQILSINQFGVLLKDPVTVICKDNKMFFNLLFHGMTDARAFPISTMHIIAFTNPSKTIIEHYNDFINKIVPETRKLNNKLSANSEVSINLNTVNTLH
tara:strand:- start:1132 stop:1494 length:363 start_codon:yes stop_codon:yes gene_type:complete